MGEETREEEDKRSTGDMEQEDSSGKEKDEKDQSAECAKQRLGNL